MPGIRSVFVLGVLLTATTSARAQVTSGVLYVNNTHMVWWGGVARDATARLYDVDAASIRLDKEAGTIKFQARKGRLVDLDKLHESIRATRLGDRTGMILKRLEVKVGGEVVINGKEVVLKVPGAEQPFVLDDDPGVPAIGDGKKSNLKQLQEAVQRGEKVVSITGQVEGWTGNFTKLLSTLPGQPRRILLSNFETAKP